jgi:TonB-linked SusC/RagA family outer membrane protein
MTKIHFLSLTMLALLASSVTTATAKEANPSSTFAASPQQTTKRITGKVLDRAGQPIIGAAIAVKGTSTGTISDIDGNFSLEVPAGTTLNVSYIGYKDTDIRVTNASSYVITLQEDAQELSEVVVTAMGIKKERKALGYSVSDVSSTELLKNKNTNVINSLAGKVPGVNITQSSGAAGSGSTIIIRGGNSTSEGRQNQPLFVVDGVIYDNSTSVVGNSGTDGMTRSNTTYSNRVMDINPDDVESMSILKGAAAAALYGSRAADGAVIITTKKGKEGHVQVDVSSRLSTSWANKLPEAQKEFGRGYYTVTGALSTDSYMSWGAKNEGAAYDNIGNFFENGSIWENSISVSGGSKTGTFYLSASNYDQGGIVPQTGYNKTTFRFNASQTYGRLTVGANVAYSLAKTDKTLTSQGLYDGGGNGAMTALYEWPTDNDMSQYLDKLGNRIDILGGQVSLASQTDNPYWIINKNKINDMTKRITGDINASFKLANWWTVSARVGYDQYTTDTYNYIAPGSAVKEMYQNGRLSKSAYNYQYISTNVMSNMQKTFGDFDLSLLIGTTSESTKWTNTTHWGYNFITPGTISFNNIGTGNQFFKDSTTRKRLVGVYGEFRASWKSMLYLSVTGRNDWSSTLPLENRSYFYPSVSGSWVFSQILPENDILTFGKVRASWAQVGKDANPYATVTYLASPYTLGDFTLVGNNYTSGNPVLKPEIQSAWEVGAELHFLNGRIGLDYTYYHSSTKNQIAQPRLSNANGYVLSSINSGSVINDGMEVALTGKPFDSKDFGWDITLNWSYNRGKLGKFLEGVTFFYPTDAQFGTVKAASIPDGGYFLGLTGTVFQKGKDLADGEESTGDTRYAVDPATGLYKLDTNASTIVANREPKFIGGLNNTLRYKDFSLSFLLDFRVGGDVYNGTAAYMLTSGMNPITTLNDRKSVTVKGVNSKTGEPFEQTYESGQMYDIGGTSKSGDYMIKAYWDNYYNNSENFITSVNWLKLRSLVLSYDFTNLIKKQKVLKRLVVNVTGNNLFTWTNYKGMDPEVSTANGTGGSGATGIDYCSVPSTSSFTFGVNLTF